MGRRLAFAGAAAVVVALDQLSKQLALTVAGRRPEAHRRLAAPAAHLQRRRRLQPRLRAHHRRRRAGPGHRGRPGPDGAHGRAPSRSPSGTASSWAARSATSSTARCATGSGFLGGRVVDFIDLQWWPVFNVADASLWVGIGLLVLASFRTRSIARRRGRLMRITEVVPEAMAGERRRPHHRDGHRHQPLGGGRAGRRRRGRRRRRTGRPTAPDAWSREPSSRSRCPIGPRRPGSCPSPTSSSPSCTRTTTCSSSTSRPGWSCTPAPASARARWCTGSWPATRRWPTVGDASRPGIVHRLDKGTSGLLLVARTQVAYEALVAALAARQVHRRYRALVWDHVEAPRGLIDAPIGRSSREPTRMAVAERGREARTRYEVLAALPGAGAGHRAGLRARDRAHPPDPRAPPLDRPPRRRRRPLRRLAAVAAARAALPARRAPRPRPPRERERRCPSTRRSPPTSPTCWPRSSSPTGGQRAATAARAPRGWATPAARATSRRRRPA